MRSLSFLLVLICFLFASPADAREPLLDLKSEDGILLYGASFVERLQEMGEFEAALQLTHPEAKLRVRSLAWTGDEVGHRLRPERYPNHLKNLLAEWPARHVIAFVGQNESFHAPDGLPAFRRDLDTYLAELQRRHPEATLVLVSPPAATARNQAEHNRHAATFAEAVRETAAKNRFGHVDLQETADPAKTLVEHLAGLHMAKRSAEQFAELARAVSHKHSINATLTRPVNAVIYYGVRARRNEYNTEMPRYHLLLKQADAIIHTIAAEPDQRLEDHLPLTLPPLADGGKRGAKKGAGTIFTPEQQQAEMKVAVGYSLNCFASEATFPELKNPVQIAVGPRGRLWVVTMPNWPHTVPGDIPSDKILILEDTDNDGTADRCTTFADGLNVPDGLAFYKDGIIISAQPRLLFMRDTDGDDRADYSEELLRGIDVTDAHHGGMIQVSPVGDVILCDGVFHRSQLETPTGVTRGVDATTYRFDPATRLVSREYQTLTPNPWKVTFDRWGNLHHMYGDGYVQDSHAIPWTPFGTYHPFGRSVYIKYGKGSGACAISSPNFPDKYQDGMASATLLGRYFVAISTTSADSGTFKAADRLDLVSSPNAAFRPVDMEFGFDGSMLISDFCSPIIGHAQHPMRDPQWDHDHGRIWRIVNKLKPLADQPPEITGANPQQLLELLKHPQDIIRLHARNRLHFLGSNAESAAEISAAAHSFTDTLDEEKNEHRQALLECLRLRISTAGAHAPPASPATLNLFEQLLFCADPMTRAGALHLFRVHLQKYPQAVDDERTFDWLTRASRDQHPRVRMQLVHALSHLQQRNPEWLSLLGTIATDDAPDLTTAIDAASLGTAPARGPEVPVLERPANSKITHWLFETEDGKQLLYEEGHPGRPKGKTAHLRTWFESDSNQAAILSVKTGYISVLVNGVPVLQAATFWSSDWNVQIELKKGLNEIEVKIPEDRRARGPAPVYVYSPIGEVLSGVAFETSEKTLLNHRESYREQEGLNDEVVIVNCVPAQLVFAPNRLQGTVGQRLKLRVRNPDVAPHNLIVVKPGTADAVGRLADALALRPNALQQGFTPKTKDVLAATRLLEFGQEQTIEFTPKEPGTYPFLCTFPGHRFVMKGEIVVQPAADKPKALSLFDGKTLDGWRVDPPARAGDWTVKDGVIHAHWGKGGARSYLIYEKDEQLANFELRFQYRMVTKGNTGVNIRTRIDKSGKRAFEGYHADLGHLGIGRNVLGAWDFHFGRGGRKEFPCPRGTRLVIAEDGSGKHTDLKDAIKDEDINKHDWNDCRIVANDRAFELHLNGKLSSAFTDQIKSGHLERGHIGLQLHDPGMRVEFKDVTLVKLPE